MKGTIDRPSATSTWRVNLEITSGGATRTETRDLPEAPVVTQNLSRLLADKRLTPGARHEWTVLDPATLQSGTFSMEWPPRSGRQQHFPEVDRAEWFTIDEAKAKINKAQTALLDQLSSL